jgi:hypothetical protein
MASEKVETVIAGNYVEMEREEGSSKSTKSKFSNFLWHGGSVYGCTSAPHIALLILTTWLVIWNPVSTFIRLDGKLDCLPY